jgi:glycosyltransferase involved in cell wall biosynthesis
MTDNSGMNEGDLNGLRTRSVSLITFAYNEEILLETQIRKWLRQMTDSRLDFEIILVDDGSTDGTAKIATALALEYEQLRVIHHETNRGVGYAARTARQYVTKEYVFWNDIDEHFSLEDLKTILLLLDKWDLVVGVKKHLRGKATFNWIKSRLNYYVIKWLFLSRIRDFQFVQFYPREFFCEGIDLESYSSFIPAECILKAEAIGLSVLQVPLDYHAQYNHVRPPKCSDLGTIMTSVKNILTFWCRWFFLGGRHQAKEYWQERFGSERPWQR